MKKNLMLLFGVVIFLLGFKFVLAETTDEEKPQINSISVVPGEFVPGGEISFVVDASDDIFGIQHLVIGYMKVGDSSEKIDNLLDVWFSGNIKNGVHTYTGTIPFQVSPYEYKFNKAIIIDNSGNKNIYMPYSGEGDYIVEDFGLSNITVKDIGADDDGPILKSLTFDKTTIDPDETILVTAEVMDESKIEYIDISFSHKMYRLTKVSDTKYTGELSFKTAGTYNFVEIQLFDEYDNVSLYRYNNGESNVEGRWEVYYELENGKYDVTVNGVVDKEAPVLKNVVILNKKVKLPASFEIYVETIDNMDEDLEVEVGFGKIEGDFSCGECSVSYKGKKNNKYIYQIIIGQYESLGKYAVNYVRLMDDSGNKAIYSNKQIEYQEHIKMEEYSFEVVQDTLADVTTSTNSDKFMDVIENTNNNSVVSIDTTKNTVVKKEVFDLIKEKEMTINLESNGIQWIFDGKNIINSKDINVDTKIFFVEDYEDIGNWKKKRHKALVIEFKNNGKLPGRVLIRIKADYAFRDYIGIRKLNLYFKNEDNFDLISKGINLTKDNYYEFYIDHNSVYFLSNETIEEKYIKNDKSDSLGNTILNSENVVNGNVSDLIILEEDEFNKEEDNIDNKISNDNKEDKKINNKYIFVIIIVAVLVVVSIICFKFLRKRKK